MFFRVSRNYRLLCLAIAALLFTLCVIGCSTYRVMIPQTGGETPQPNRSKVVWSFFWVQTAKNPITDPNECDGAGLQVVTVKSNFFFDLISVVTLGLACPKTVEWYCAQPNPTPGRVPDDANDLGCDTTLVSESCDTVSVSQIICCKKYIIECGRMTCDTMVVVDSAGGR